MKRELEKIIKEASNIMKEGFSEVIQKGDVANVVSDADLRTQDFLVQKLQALLPESSFILEESSGITTQEGYQWVIDPIDGTSNYVYGLMHSAISIALLYNQEAQIGICYNPYTDELFYAKKGKGATCNNKPIHVRENALSNGLVMVGTAPYNKDKVNIVFENMKKLFLAGKDIRRSGSAVLDLCYLACGRLDGFYEQVLSPWDYAAGALLVEEAGGEVLTIEGTFGYDKPYGIIAGNKTIAKEIIELVK